MFSYQGIKFYPRTLRGIERDWKEDQLFCRELHSFDEK